jgi:hypothetical protein
MDCRDGEHYFLKLFISYRQFPELYRKRIAEETDPTQQANLAARYEWLKQNWYEGQEYGIAEARNASLEQAGVPLLPTSQPVIAEEVPIDPNGGGCGSGGACGAGASMSLLLMLIPSRRIGPRIRRSVTRRSRSK